MPSIQKMSKLYVMNTTVLNLIITGIPSIQGFREFEIQFYKKF